MPLLALLLLLILWRYALWWPRALPGVTRSRPLLIGHRGVRGARPENSLAAFRMALDAGLDGVECDVQRSCDGALVLYHDFELPDGRLLTALTLQELERADPNLPRLERLLELAKDYPGTLLNLEIKTNGLRTQGLEQTLVKLVKRHGLESRVLVSSFNPVSILYVRLCAPSLRTALLFAPEGPRGLRSGGLAGWLHVDALHPHHSVVNREMVARAHRRGLMLNTWTVNEAEEVARLVKLGVDGVVADAPEALKRAARKKSL